MMMGAPRRSLDWLHTDRRHEPSVVRRSTCIAVSVIIASVDVFQSSSRIKATKRLSAIIRPMAMYSSVHTCRAEPVVIPYLQSPA